MTLFLKGNSFLLFTEIFSPCRSAQINDQELRNKLDLCRQLDQVLGKIDPGYSEIRSFIQKELHFTHLMVNQR